MREGYTNVYGVPSRIGQIRLEARRCAAVLVVVAGRAVGRSSGRSVTLFTSQYSLYNQPMLTIPSRIDVMNRLGRAMADPTRSRILLSLLEQPGYPAQLAHDLGLTRSNVSNHLSCLRGCGIVVAVPEGRSTRYELVETRLANALRAMLDVALAVNGDDDCIDEDHRFASQFVGATA